MADWREAVDPRSGRTYFANVRTKKTTWVMPEELRRLKEEEDDDEAPPPPPPAAARQPSVSEDLPAPWREVADRATGKVYFYNPVTRQALWERPRRGQAAVAEVDSDDDDDDDEPPPPPPSSQGAPRQSASSIASSAASIAARAAALQRAKPSPSPTSSRKGPPPAASSRGGGPSAAELARERERADGAEARAGRAEARADRAENESAALRTKLSEAESRSDTELKDIRAAAASLKTSVANLTTENERLQSKLASLEEQKAASASSAAVSEALERRVKELEQRNQELAAEAGEMRAVRRERDQLQADLVKSVADKGEMAKLREEVARLRREAEDAEAAVVTTRAQVITLTKSNSELEQLLETAKSQAAVAPVAAAAAPAAAATTRQEPAVSVSQPPSFENAAIVDPLPPGWKEAEDPTTKKPYFFNEAGTVTWVRPKAEKAAEEEKKGKPAAAAPASSASQSSMASSASSAGTSGSGDAPKKKKKKKTMEVDDLADWREVKDDKGRTYWYNTTTRASSWLRPVARGGGEGTAAAAAASAAANTIAPPPRASGRRWSLSSRQPAGGGAAAAIICAHTNDDEITKMLPEEERRKLSLLSFAESNFAAEKGGMLRKGATVAERLQFKKGAQKQPLQTLAKQLEPVALQVARNVQSYMLDRKSSKPPAGHVAKLCAIGLSEDELIRDEIFLLICRQVTNHPDRTNKLRGWRLLSIILGVFPPSKRFAPFLRVFLQEARGDRSDSEVPLFARFAEAILHRSLQRGPRASPAALVEIEAAENHRAIMFDIFIGRDEARTVAVSPQSTVEDVVLAVASKLELPQRDGVPLWHLLTVDPFTSRETPVDFNARVLDARESFLSGLGDEHRDLEVKFVFRPRLVLAAEVDKALPVPSALGVFFSEAVRAVLRGDLSCGQPEAVTLCALQLAAENGAAVSVDKELGGGTEQLLLYFNKQIVQKSVGNEQGLCKAVAEQVAAHKGLEGDSARRKYLEIVRALPVYGATLFPVTRKLARHEEEAIVGVSERGIFVLHSITKQLTKKVIELKDVHSFTVVEDGVSFTAEGEQQHMAAAPEDATLIQQLFKAYRRDLRANK